MLLEAELLLHIHVCFCCVHGPPVGCGRSQLVGHMEGHIKRGNWSNLWAALSSRGVWEMLLSGNCHYEIGRRKLSEMQEVGRAFTPIYSPLKLLISLERCNITYSWYFHPHPTPDLKMELEAPGPCHPIPPSATTWGGIQGATSSPALHSAERTQT